ncbi:MAG: DUF333 domain-containing protein [Candidatus Gracilibacteria bacterium]|nr:DUF333 domain-containing protein [Candidatus Gracilibacteria bacterium]
MKKLKFSILIITLCCIYNYSFALANPASVKCINDGGNLSIEKDISGGEFGICTFSNGFSCEEWAYFRGECNSYQSLSLDFQKIDDKNYTLDTKNNFIHITANFSLTNNEIIDNKIYEYVKYTAKDFLQNLPADAEKDIYKYELDISGDFKKIGNITTFEFIIYGYYGGYHGETYVKTFNFKKDGTEILLKNKKFIKILSKYLTNYFLNKSPGDENWEEDLIKDGLAPNIDNFSNWLITGVDKENLKIVFIFSQYQISSYYNKIPSIEITINKNGKFTGVDYLGNLYELNSK